MCGSLCSACPAEECGVGVRAGAASLCSACPAEECGVGVRKADASLCSACALLRSVVLV